MSATRGSLTFLPERKKMAGKVQNRRGREVMLCNFARSAGYFATAIVLPWFIGAVAAPTAEADESYNPIAIVQLPGGSQPLGSTDIAWVNHHTYGLTDRSNQSVDIIDTRKNDTILPVTATPAFAGAKTKASSAGGPNGVILMEGDDDDNVRIWAADGPFCPSGGNNPNPTTDCLVKNGATSGSIKVIDLNLKSKQWKTKQVIYVNPNTPPPLPGAVHGRVDEFCINRDHHLVLAASNAFNFGDRFLSFIDTRSFAIVGTIRLDGTDPAGQMITAVGGKIEQCQVREGKFYLSVPNIDPASNAFGAVLKISAETFQVEEVFKIAATTGCAGPAGLTIGPDHQILVGCNGTSTQSVIIDDRTGFAIQYVATTYGVDEVWYDSGSNHYYLAQNCTAPCAAGTAVMNVEDAGHRNTVPSPDNPPAATAPSSKNPAADPETNYVYLPVLAGMGSICSKFGGSDSQGCIAIYSAPLDGDDRGGGDNALRRARK